MVGIESRRTRKGTQLQTRDRWRYRSFEALEPRLLLTYGDVILFDESTDHHFSNAMDELAITHTSFDQSQFGAFSSAVAFADPAQDVLVIQSRASNHNWTNVINFVNQGGRAILEHADLDSEPALAAAFETQVVADETTPRALRDWTPGALFTHITPRVLELAEMGNVDDGDSLRAVGTAVAVAGYTPLISNEGGIIVGNNIRTLVNGFLLDNAVDDADAARMAKNEIIFQFAGRFYLDYLTGGSFHDPLAWTVGGAPSNDDIAVFFTGIQNDVTFNSNVTNRRLEIFDVDLNFDLNGNTYVLADLTSTEPDFLLTSSGIGSAANLTIDDGTVNAKRALLGAGFDEEGNITLTDAHLGIDERLIVGGQGEASINVVNGSIRSPNAILGESDRGSGVVELGFGTNWLIIGDLEVGVEGIGQVVFAPNTELRTGDTYLGRLAGGQGTMLVSGSGVEWINQRTMNIGEQGAADVFIEGGAEVTTSFGTTIDGMNSLLSVDGITTQYLDGGAAVVGSAGNAELRVSDGGYVTSDRATIGLGGGSNGTVLVRGRQGNTPATWDVANQVTIGNRGTATVQIENGGRINSQRVVVANEDGSDGTIHISGANSLWDAAEDVIVGGTVFDGGDGLLVIENNGQLRSADEVKIQAEGHAELRSGGTLSAPKLDISSFATVLLDGGRIKIEELEGLGEVNWTSGLMEFEEAFPDIYNMGSGTLSPSPYNSTDTTTEALVVGMYDQGANARLRIEIGGTGFPGPFEEPSAAEFDSLESWYEMNLDGTLEVVLVDGYVPQAGDSFEILKFPMRTGDFSNYVLPQIHLVEFVPTLTDQDLTLNVVEYSEIRGTKFHDLDGDGIFDPDEHGLNNWTIYLDENGDGQRNPNEPTTQTNTFGQYVFTNLTPGTHTVREVFQAGWLPTAPTGGAHTVTVGGRETASGIDFGSARPGEIHGIKWHDLDGDGTRDASEPVLANWPIYLDLNVNGIQDVGNEPLTITDANGAYSFTNLPPGPYTVAEAISPIGVISDNWRQTSPGRLATTLDDFEDGNLDEYTSAQIGRNPFIESLNIHDGSRALSAGSWIHRDDPGATLAPGDTLSAWVFFRGPSITIGRAYLGFAASSIGTTALVLDGASDQFAIQEHDAYDDSRMETVGTVPQTFTSEKWYRAELDWGRDGDLVGRLYDSDGVTLLNTVVGNTNNARNFAPGGIAIRGTGGFFSSVKFDTITRTHNGTRTLIVNSDEVVTGFDLGGAHGAVIQGSKWDDQDTDGVRDAGEPALADWSVYLDTNQNQIIDRNLTTIGSADVPRPIPIEGTVVSTLPVNAVAGLIVDVDVTLDITHDFNQDLDVYLISPTGTRVELFSDVGGSLDNFTATTLDDEASTSITAGTEPFTGSFRPEGQLADFDAQEPNGTWILEVTQDTNRPMSVARAINSWTLSLTVGDPLAQTDQNGNYAFTDVTPRSYTVREDHQPTWTQTFPGTTSGGTLYGLAPFLGASQLVTIDTNTGAAVPVGPTGRQTLIGLTAGSDGTVYSIPALGDGLTRNLYSVDTATGSITSLFSLGTGVTFDEGGLAKNPSANEILAMDTVGTQGNPQLYRIDLTAQTATLLGNIGLVEEPLPRGVDVDGLTFAGNTLYGLITGDLGTLGGILNDHLIMINNQLRVIDVGPLGVDIGITAGLAYDPGQDAFYASGEGNDNLYRVDRATGAATLIGPTGVNQLSGLVFVSGAVQETDEHTVALGSGTNANNIHFGNAQLGGAIHGIKWNDQDGDGVQDPSEPGIDGVTIEIVDPDTGQVIASQVTHSRDLNQDGLIDPATEKGVYRFNSVLPGTYHVQEILPENTRQTFPGGRGRLFAVEVVQRDITDGELVSGSIGTPGEQDTYHFSLSDDARLYFDVLLDDSNMRWTLIGPSGTVVDNRNFSQSDSFDRSNPVLDLFSGSYVLTVDGFGDHTAMYAFRLLNLDDADALIPGTQVSVIVDPANATQMYEFSATGNERFYFDMHSGSVNAVWRLVDPYSNIVFSAAASQDHETATLPVGKYTLMIEGRRFLAGTQSYHFNVQPLPASSTTTVTVGAAVSGDISVPGEQDEYAFTLLQERRLHFDSLTDANTINWSLEGPSGTVVANRAFGQSNAFGSSQPVLDLVGGDYRLVVDGSSDNTGSYGFRLLNVDGGTAITPGVPVTDVLFASNQTNIYGFDAVAGDQFYFDVLNGYSNATWRLVDPHSRVLFSSAFTTDHNTLAIDVTGHYALLIEGWQSQPLVVNYQFHVQPVAPATPTALTIGNTVSDTISVAGEVDIYTFTLPIATRLHFDALAGTSIHRWSLIGPTGTLVNARSMSSSDSFGFADPVLEMVAGEYTLTVDGTLDNTGAYSFRLLDLAAATQITLGNQVNGILDPGNESALYRFDAVAGDEMEFDLVSGTASATWRLMDPYGNVLFSGTFSTSRGPITLTRPGTYFLVIEGQLTAVSPASFSFTVKSVGNTPPPAPTGIPLTVGTTATGSISVAGEEDDFVLTLANDAQLYFDSLTNDGNLRWDLVGPPGTIVSNRSFTASDSVDNNTPVLDLVAGQYVLTIRAFSTNTGAFSFRLLDLTAATSISLGTSITATLNPANSTHLYQFNALAGEHFYLDSQAVSGLSNAYWRLADPYGQILVSRQLARDGDTITLANSGTFTVMIEGRFNDTVSGDYTVNVQPVPASVPVALNLNALTSGNIAVTGETVDHQFSLAAAARLYFDSRTNDANLRWTLAGPMGEIVSRRPFTASDSVDVNQPVIDAVAGDYTLTVDGNGDHTAAFSFQLLNIGTAAPINPGIPTNGTLNPGNETHMVRFNAVAGNAFYVNSLNVTGLPNAYWRIVGPYNDVVAIRRLNTDQDTFQVNATGTYTLFIEGRIMDDVAGDYSLNVQPIPLPAPSSIALRNIVSGEITLPGESDRYAFSLTTDKRVYFDSYTPDSSIRWDLWGPSGQVVNQRSFTASDSIDLNRPVLDLVAGDYLLTVDAGSDHTGPYSFQLKDLTVATPLTPGISIIAALVPANETRLYQFTANVEQYYFDSLTTSTGKNAWWRLVDPYNNIVFTSQLQTDVDTQQLIPGETYTLLVEGRYIDTGTTNYSLNVQPIAQTLTQTESLGSIVNGDISVAGESDAYRFSIGAPARVYFDVLTGDNAVRWSLAGPAGQEVANRRFGSSDSVDQSRPVLDLVAGDYSLTVDGVGDHAGPYSFRLLDLAAAVPLTIGTSVNDALNPQSETRMYRFTGTAGDSLRFDSQSVGSPNNVWWRLVDPYDNTLFLRQLSIDADNIELTVDGTYTLLVEGRQFDTGSLPYQFNVELLSNTPPPTVIGTPLTLGSDVNGSIALAGEEDIHTFTLPNDARLHFDTLDESENMRWTLVGPSGTIVSRRSFRSSDSSDRSNTVMILPSGDYVLTVSATGNNTGNYAFRLLDLADATPLTPGMQVTGTLNPSPQSHMYRWEANADDRYYFNVLDGFSDATWRLIDPYDNVLFSRVFTTDEDTLTTSQAGTYTVLIEGRWTTSGTAPYRFNVHRVVDDIPASDIVEVDMNDGTVVNRFSTPAPVTIGAGVAFDGTRLYFVNGSRTVWTVDAETGAATMGAVTYPSDLLGVTTIAGHTYLHQADENIVQIDPVSGAVLNTIDLAAANLLIRDGLSSARGPDGLLMIDQNGSTLYEMDPTSGNVTNSFAIANSADDLATIGSQVYVMSRESPQLDVLARTGTFVGNVTLDLSGPPVAIGGAQSATGEGFHAVDVVVGEIVEDVDFGNRIALLGPNLVRWDGTGLFGNQGDGSSWGDGNNWSANGYADVLPSARGDDVVFGRVPVPVSINLGSNQVANSLSFAGDYEISGNSLSITSGKISVGAGATAVINSDITTNNGLLKEGSGTLKVNGGVGDVVVRAGFLGGTGVVTNLTFQGGGLASTSALTVAGTTNIMERVTVQLAADMGTTLNSAELAIAADTELRIEAKSQVGSAGDHVLTLFTADKTAGKFSVEPAVGEHLGSGVFASEVPTTGSAVKYDSDRVSVSVFQAQFGDANGDRVVDGTDFNVWSQHRFQNGQTWLDGDFTGDLVVDGSDFNLWLDNRFTLIAAELGNNSRLRTPRAPLVQAAAPTTADAVFVDWLANSNHNTSIDSSRLPGILVRTRTGGEGNHGDSVLKAADQVSASRWHPRIGSEYGLKRKWLMADATTMDAARSDDLASVVLDYLLSIWHRDEADWR